MRYLRAFIAVFALIAVTGPAAAQTSAQDYPQWRGQNRDGSASGFVEPKAWPEQLTPSWKVEVGAGYATPIVVGNRVYTHTRQGENEVMLALDAATGKVVWQTPYPAPYKMNPATKNHGQGPKSTPLFYNGRLYTLGISGIVSAFQASDGKLLWQKAAPPVDPLYGTAMSPVADKGVVIFHVGGHNQGALTAFDAVTGDVKWSWNGDGPAYASPIVTDFGGTRQLVTRDAAERRGDGCRDRRPPLAAPVGHAGHQQLDHAHPLRRQPDHHGPGQRRHRVEAGAPEQPVDGSNRLGDARRRDVHEQPGGRRGHAVRAVAPRERPVLRARPERRQGVVARRAASGRQHGDRQGGRDAVHAERGCASWSSPRAAGPASMR